MTSPRTGAVRPQHLRVTREIDAQSPLGEVYMSSLVRTQLRLGLGILAALGLGVLTLPLVFALIPGVRSLTVLGMPLPWVLLAFVVYPFFVLLGWIYVRRSERNERAFTDVVGS